MISVLIPTSDRAYKLRRMLRFIDLCLKHDRLRPLWQSIDVHIVIASTSRSDEYSSAIKHAEDLGLQIEFGPAGLPERLRLLGARITSDYAMLLGDDDLPVLEGIASAASSFPRDSAVVATRFANIRRIRLRSPKIDLDFSERPYWGIEITDVEPRVRVAQGLMVNSFGVSSLAYGLFRAQHLQDFLMRLPHLSYHSSIEVALLAFAAARGGLHYSSELGLLRDFTYMDYVKDDEREAPEGSNVPYIGEHDLLKIAEFLKSEVPRLQDVAPLLRASVAPNGQFDASRQQVRTALERSPQPDKASLRSVASVQIAGQVWNETYQDVYEWKTRFRRRIGRVRDIVTRR